MLGLRRLIKLTGSVTSGYLLHFLIEVSPADGELFWVSSSQLVKALGIKRWDYSRDMASLDAAGHICIVTASSRGTQLKINLIDLYNQLDSLSLDEDIREYSWMLGRAKYCNESLSNITINSSPNSTNLSNIAKESNISLSNISIDSSNPSIDSSNNSIEVSHKDESPSLSPPSQTLSSLSLPLIREEKEEEKILRASDVPETPLCVTFSWEAFRPSDYSISLAEGTDVNLRLLASRFKDWHLKRNKVYCDMETAQQVFHTWLKTDIQRGSKFTKKGKLKLTL